MTVTVPGIQMDETTPAGPVFIIGGSRTGSEFLKDFISQYSDIDIVPEMCLLCPRWLHTDFQTNIRQHVGDLHTDDGVERLIHLMYSKIPFGYFWQVMDRIDRDSLRARLLASDRSLKSILDSIMVLHAARNEKVRLGAKFPVYYSHSSVLRAWFPNCKIIHTMRDPRAVYASQASKHLRAQDSLLRRSWIRLKHFLQIYLQFFWTVRIHNKLKGDKRYLLSRFEDFLLEPEATIRRLCDFLDIECRPEMMTPQLRRNSSYKDRHSQSSGLEISAMDEWRHRIHPFTAGLIYWTHHERMKQMGYSSPDTAQT